MHILSLVTDNIPSWISGRRRMTRKYFMINHHESMRPGKDWTHKHWISNQTHFQLPYGAWLWASCVKLFSNEGFQQKTQSGKELIYGLIFYVRPVLQIILTTIRTGTGRNETWSIPAIFNTLAKPNFYENLYLYLKLSSCTVWLPINENSDVPIYIHVGKNIGTGNPDDCFYCHL